MNQNSKWYPLLLLNMGMLFSSSSGAFGRYIDLSPPLTIGYRAFIALVLLALYGLIQRHRFQFDLKQHGLIVFLSGILMALHWVLYFYALRWGSVAIGMLSLFTYPIITVFLEPLFLPVKLQKRHLFLGILILFGIYFLVPDFNIQNTSTQGLLIGLFSAVSYSLRNIILKKSNAMGNESVQMIYQLAVIIILLLPFHWIYPNIDIRSQWPYLLILGIFTTAIGHTLFLGSFYHFRISTVSIISSIQPLFGVLLGIFFLSEIPDLKSMLGGALILSTVVIESRSSKPDK